MKKIIIILFCILFITGCTNVGNLSYDDIVENFSTRALAANIYRTGYKYYLPDGFAVMDSSNYNEVLKDAYSTYYLHVDVISYYNKVNRSYIRSNKAVYSTGISFDKKTGYVEINLVENDKYLVEIMYNYAKIEVIVDKENSNMAMLSAINILKSIEYNDNTIANILGDNILNFTEEDFDIFRTHTSDSDYIEIEEIHEDVEDQIPDIDLIS